MQLQPPLADTQQQAPIKRLFNQYAGQPAMDMSECRAGAYVKMESLVATDSMTLAVSGVLMAFATVSRVSRPSCNALVLRRELRLRKHRVSSTRAWQLRRFMLVLTSSVWCNYQPVEGKSSQLLEGMKRLTTTVQCLEVLIGPPC